MQLRIFFISNGLHEAPQKHDSVPTRFVNPGLVDKLSNGKMFPMEAVKDRKKVFRGKVRHQLGSKRVIEKILLS